jgi:hypothetical protein
MEGSGHTYCKNLKLFGGKLKNFSGIKWYLTRIEISVT